MFFTLLDMILRFLSFYYRTRHVNEVGLERYRFPNYFFDVLTVSSVARRIIRAEDIEDPAALFRVIRGYLEHYGVADPLLRIRRENLFVHLPSDSFWECQTCKSIHMFHADGQCRTIKHRQRCDGALLRKPIADLLAKDNYYKDFLKENRHEYPTRTAEVIGHTPQAA